MSSTDHIDFSTLTWVKSELDETLNRAKEALKAYVEDSEDINQLQFCVTYLHQVQGTLKMVELYGAAMVAEEMEGVAKDLIEDNIRDKDSAYDTLMQSILRLPDYLERIELGHKDVPIVLLPLVNDLRAVRSQKLLSESALFNPNLTLGVPDRLMEGDFSMSGAQLKAALKKVRTVYQVSLLNWIKQINGDKALSNIQVLVTKLQTLVSALHLKQLFWVYSAVIEGMRAKTIEDSVAAKQVAGEVDMLLRDLSEDTNLSASKTNPTTKNLLYFIATGSGKGRLASEVKNFFNLEQFIPDEEEIKHAEGSLSGKNKDLLQTVSEAINDDVLVVQESLDLYIRNKSADNEELRPLLDTMQKIADTLGILGLGVARENVLLHSTTLEKAIDNNERPTDEDLLDVAKSLLMLESQLGDHIHSLGGQVSPAEDADHSVPKTEQIAILKQLAKESIVNLQQIKSNFVAYIESPWDKGQINDNPKLLQDIAGALKILQLEQASEQMLILIDYINGQIIKKKATPSAPELDQLATTISTFEYYLENLDQGQSIQNNLMEKVTAQVEKLQGFAVELSDDEIETEAPFTESESDQAPVTEEAVESGGSSEVDGVESAETEVAAPVAKTEPSVSNDAIVGFGDDVDDEFKEIFLEEYQEELGNLQAKYAMWQEDPENNADAMGEIRRIFHTLKGSGRMVGAELVGEFGWQMENMCNRLLDGAIEQTATFRAVLNSGVTMAADMYEALKDGLTLPAGYSKQLANAESVATGAESLPEPAQETVEETAIETAAEAEEEVVESEVEEAVETEAADVDPAETTDSETTEAAESVAEEVTTEGVEDTEVVADDVDESLDLNLDEDLADLDFSEALEDVEAEAEATDEGAEESAEEVLDLDEDLADLDFSEALDELTEEVETEDEASETAATEGVSEEAMDLSEDLADLDFSEALEEIDGDLESEDSMDLEEAKSPTDEVLDLSDDLADLDFSDVLAEETDSAEAEEAEMADEAEEAEAMTLSSEDLAEIDFSDALDDESDYKDADEEAVLDLSDAVAEEDFTDALNVTEIEDTEDLLDLDVSDEEAEAIEMVATEDESSEVEVDEEATVAESDDSDLSVDPVFIEILQNEVGGHIETLEAYLESASEEVTEEFIRVVHTLNGAASMAEVKGITHMTAPLEKMSVLLNERQQNFTEADIKQIESTVAQAKAIMADLATGEYEADASMGDYFADRIVALKAEAVHDMESDTPDSLEEAVIDDIQEAGEEGLEAEEAVAEEVEETVETVAEETEAEEETVAAAEEEAVEAEPAPDPVIAQEVAAVTADLDDELLEIFSEEAGEIFDRSEHLLAELDDKPDDLEIIQALQRDLHTLKGGARMAGLNQIGDLSHQLESLFESIAEKGATVTSVQHDMMSSVMDKLHGMITSDDYGQLTSIEHESQLLEKVLNDEGTEIKEESQLDKEFFDPLNQAVSPLDDVQPMAEQEDDTPADAPKKKANVLSGGQIKVNAELLDKLVNFAGEVSIYRSRMEQQSAELRLNIDELENTVERVRRLLRELEHETEAQIISTYQHEGDELEEDFDPLELDQFSTIQQLSRSLAESVSDLSNIQNYLQESARSSETLLLQQSRVNTELQEGLMETRLVTFNSLVPRLRRVLRTASSELDKKAKLTVVGAEGEMDKTVLEGIQAPLEHMIRNSMVHGLESDRKAAGKPEQGNIDIKLSREATEVVITVSDDGAGINTDVVRAKAIERGIIDADADISDQEVAELITHSGLSAADEVTKLAGRGVGMDVVSNEIKRLGGGLEIISRKGEGTSFIIRLPYTLALTQAIIVQVADHRYAIPASGVEGLIRMTHDEFKRRLADGDLDYDYAGDQYHIQELNKLLSVDSEAVVEGGQVPLVMIKTGDQGVALRVDQTFGGREIVVKSVGTQVASVPGIFGATILGDGAVVLILDIIPMHRAYTQKIKAMADEGIELVEEVEEDTTITVMVVDDSITMRRAGERMLTRNDFEVMTAKDGVDALSKLQEQVPDLMLLDIEMPRMDGFELATEMKKSDKFKDIPIIMITSRTGQKHKDRAKSIGVDRYLGKPYQELELLENINDLLNLEDVEE